ncbi:MAG: uracil phosphoribosyltransferase [Bacteroidetes bacterium]|nr:uracil phosphoribosyltransferase [Bacteroidota bacterium]
MKSMVFNLSEHNSIANRFLSELRDVNIQKDRLRFRRNLERFGEIMAYEISKTLEYTNTQVETPLGIAKVNMPDENVVLATILRAGLPVHQGLLNFFDKADNSFVSAFRKHHKDGTFEIKLDYVSCPDLEGKTLILADSMLATGASINLCIKQLFNHSIPKKLHIVSAVASTYGLNYVKRLHPKADIWLGAIDDELTAKSYIVPGLGDAGDLCYGSKLQD